MLSFDPKVAHLLRRATLGPTLQEIQNASEDGLQATLEKLLAQFDRPLSSQEAAAQAIGGVFLRDLESLRAGWMLRMLNSPNLFREKLTVFWHGHFATAISKVKDPVLMANQIDMLRASAMGSFHDMLLSVARDPAMVIWLDNAENVAGHANENFARELMELFTLGIGHYTEKDVQEVARCFTGWNMEGKQFKFVPDKHDDGQKTVLGQSGNLDGTDVLEHLSKSKECPQFICKKLWRFFVSQDVTDEDVQPMVDAYFASDRQIAPVLKAMFGSPKFFAPENQGNQVKSPVEFIVGTVRALNADMDVTRYGLAVAALGQDLYNPPDVSGWKGGEDWISSYTLLERIRLVRQLTAKPSNGHVAGLDLNLIITQNFLGTNDELVDHFTVRFLYRDPSPKLRGALLEYLAAGTHGVATVKLPPGARDEKICVMIRTILCSPDYQLC
jgi:uncharacterized protein (DUF1800 family)